MEKKHRKLTNETTRRNPTHPSMLQCNQFVLVVLSRSLMLRVPDGSWPESESLKLFLHTPKWGSGNGQAEMFWWLFINTWSTASFLFSWLSKHDTKKDESTPCTILWMTITSISTCWLLSRGKFMCSETPAMRIVTDLLTQPSWFLMSRCVVLCEVFQS